MRSFSGCWVVPAQSQTNKAGIGTTLTALFYIYKSYLLI
ncbi:Unknown protein sequence [Pseudomonas amygdali pv. sesami]|nr:Unknown protein sequence [Pseudomonas amygdali pv. sesami]